jgi:alpha-beta hydrolase superfamily lysophospholipase/SAM-dependent methyltransferase
MTETVHRLTSWDGTSLFYRAWLPSIPTDKALLLFHRGHEHSGRWRETVEALGLDDVACFALDARGHGRSAGERGAGSLTDVIRDVDFFARHISEEHDMPLENTIVLAHSLAAVNVAAWVHDYAPPIRAMILATAAFKVKLYVPLAIPALRSRQKFLGPGRVTSYVTSGLLTRDRTEAARYDADRLIFRQIAVNLLLDLHDTAGRLMADAGAILTPTLMICAGRDWVVRAKAQQQFFNGLSSPVKEIETYPNARHAIFHDLDRHIVVGRIRSFIRERFAASVTSNLSLLKADEQGYTRAEFDRLCSGGGLRFSVARAGLRAAGHLSRGVEIGWRTGFDSGLSLDYVYENKPRGVTPLGRLIDKSYLNTIGWRGIRQRKLNLKHSLTKAISELHRQSRPVRILDIAAGGGRYVVETMHSLPAIPVSAVLRDYKEENIAKIRALAEEFGLTAVTAVQGDAFDAESIASTGPKATIGLVSGLYELFSSNAAVLNSLRGLADAIETDGYLIYTNQPWHPQVEFIARVLRNREGEPWIMRRRTTAEIDELIRIAGFTKLSMELDQWGMFTVSIARRNGK